MIFAENRSLQSMILDKKTSSYHKFLFHLLILSFQICTYYICIYFWEASGIGLPGYDTAIFTSISLDLALHCFLSPSKFNVYIVDKRLSDSLAVSQFNRQKTVSKKNKITIRNTIFKKF